VKATTAMTTWRCKLIIYSRIDVPGPRSLFRSKRFTHELPSEEIDHAVESFKCFPSLVSDLTEGNAGIRYEIHYSQRTLSSLTELSQGGAWWPSPDDTQEELSAGEGKCDSIFILWPQNNLQKGTSIKSGGWGLGMGASPWSRCATYATVANVSPEVWQVPMKGEVWLHEWLHGVCNFFEIQGYEMPAGDADGADRHGYVRSPEKGWTGYYRDLMNGRVIEAGKARGIPTHAWSIPFSYEMIE